MQLFKKMMHKPTQRKYPKGHKGENQGPFQQNKIQSKPQQRSGGRSVSIPQKVQKLEKNIEKLQQNVMNPQMQAILIEEIRGIKNQLHEIKQHIGLTHGSKHETYPAEEEEESIYAQNPKSHNHVTFHQEQVQQPVVHRPRIPVSHQQQVQEHVEGERGGSYRGKQELWAKEKQMIDIGRIQPYMKDFKMEGNSSLMPFYRGYHKKTSKPVIIKYCDENKSMDAVFNLYQKFWKNIVKAKKICINKFYDLNEPLASHILILEANKKSLPEITTPPAKLLVDLLRALQFFHECGYLYRNIHPSHIMESYEGNTVLIDFKQMRRFVDGKGRHLEVLGHEEETIDEFSSNSRVRRVREGRKDDLESLGYLALYLFEGALPWTLRNLVEVRSRMTLKQLFGRHEALFQYMIVITKMASEQNPHYDKLAELLHQC